MTTQFSLGETSFNPVSLISEEAVIASIESLAPTKVKILFVSAMVTGLTGFYTAGARLLRWADVTQWVFITARIELVSLAALERKTCQNVKLLLNII